VLHRRYQGSALKTLPTARTIAYHRRRKTCQTKVDRFIALTEFGKRKYVAGGYAEKRILGEAEFLLPAECRMAGRV